MGQKAQKPSVDLAADAVAYAAYNAWVAAKDAIEKAEAAKDDAQKILGAYLDKNEAEVGTVAGKKVLNRVMFRKVSFDATILRKLAPVAARKAEKPYDVVQYRKG